MNEKDPNIKTIDIIGEGHEVPIEVRHGIGGAAVRQVEKTPGESLEAVTGPEADFQVPNAQYDTEGEDTVGDSEAA